MATCTVTLNSSVTAVTGAVLFEPLPNQAIDGAVIDVALVVATAASSAYTATLVRKAKYRIISDRFAFTNPIFTVPDSATADLDDLLVGVRTA